jgi:hypothetical protein
MNWNIVKEWLETHGHINPAWDCIGIGDDSFYAEDKTENTFISIFTRGEGELVLYVGCRRPKISVGSGTGYYVSNIWDVIDFLEDNLEGMYDQLMEKVIKGVNNKPAKAEEK